MSFSFGNSGLFSFNTTTTTSGFSFSTPVATTTTAAISSLASSTPAITTAATTTTSASPFILGGGDPGAASKTTQPQLGLQTTSGTKFTLSTTTATAATTSAASTFTGFSFPTSTHTTAAATLTLSTSLTAVTTTQATLGTTTVVTSSTAVSSPSLNFSQLEEAINKWTLELEEQEKLFINQASQVNAWDRLLIANGEKIINLNNSVEQVKLEQKQLDRELEFIRLQQKELEDLLEPLEKELETNGVSDPEREHTYQLAENLDTQLKKMSEDLKEIVEHINETNRSQDHTDPIVQIGRILNAHMNSLQWIDQNTTLIGSHLDQVAKLHETLRRENERSFHLTYD